MKNLLFCALTLALASSGVGLAQAATLESESATLTVHHDDLDLATRHGARLMLQRLDHAAAEVCGASSFVSLELRQSVRRTECYQQTMNRALAALDAPAVNALYYSSAVSLASN